MDTRTLLAKHPLFATLPPATFDALATTAQAAYLDTGERLWESAAPCLLTRGNLQAPSGIVTDGDLFTPTGTYALTPCAVLHWPESLHPTLTTLGSPYETVAPSPSPTSGTLDATALAFAMLLQIVYAALEVAPWVVIGPLVDHCLLFRDATLWPLLLATLFILATFGVGACVVHGVLVTPLATTWATALRQRTIATIFHSVAMPHASPPLERWWQRLRTTLRAIDQLNQHGALWVHEACCVTFCIVLSTCLAPVLTLICLTALVPLAVWRMASGRLQVNATHEMFVLQLLRAVHCLLVLVLGVQAVHGQTMSLGRLVAVLGLWLSAWDSSMHLLPLRALPSTRHRRSTARTGSSAFLPRAHVTFKNVTASYSGATQPALVNFSLDIPPGTAMGLVGRSGSGKSTVARLIFGMITASRGQVLLDGVAPQWWNTPARREHLAWLDDRPFLPHPTLLNNLTAAAHGPTLARMRWACEVCALNADALAQAPANDAVLLRLTLARALMRRPKILILDNFFAPLTLADTERLLTNLRAAAPAMSLLVMSRVPRTVASLPHVQVLNGGMVVCRGTPASLAAGPSLYHYLQGEHAS